MGPLETFKARLSDHSGRREMTCIGGVKTKERGVSHLRCKIEGVPASGAALKLRAPLDCARSVLLPAIL